MSARPPSPWTVTSEESGQRLDKFLASSERLGSRSRVTSALERGKIFINDTEASPSDASRRLVPGDLVKVWMDRPGSARRRLSAHVTGGVPILYEDEHLVVLDKPVGLLAVPLDERRAAGSAYDHVEDHLRSHGKRRPLVVHRIDRDTSGLVVFAKSAAAQAAVKDQFRRREPERVYWAVVYGHPQPSEGTWEDRLVWDQRALIQKETHTKDPRGVDARCHYRVLERFANTSLVEVRLDTGKRNQIRLQARLRGHTLVGEQRYIYGPKELRPVAFPRQALHAYRLSFRHPTTGAPLAFEAPLPKDMVDLLARLRRDSPPEGRDARASAAPSR